jgi:[NiFe] hydrogenase assembly HybE family chaperone
LNQFEPDISETSFKAQNNHFRARQLYYNFWKTFDWSNDMTRILSIVERFQMIGEQNVQDLPIYNHKLKVEAVNFQRLNDKEWLGVLITPWFMDLMIIPEVPEPWDIDATGKRVSRALPAKTYQFIQGGDEVLGSYLTCSLYSPMDAFDYQELAQSAALSALHTALTPPEPPPPAEYDRREFLRGNFLK